METYASSNSDISAAAGRAFFLGCLSHRCLFGRIQKAVPPLLTIRSLRAILWLAASKSLVFDFVLAAPVIAAAVVVG